MRATISGSEGRSESLRVGACGISMRALSLLLGAVVLAGLPGCLRLGFDDGSDTRLPGMLQRTRSTEK